MKNLLFIFLILPFLSAGQLKRHLLFGISINNGVENIDKKDKDLNAKKINAIGYYVSLGLKKEIDSIYILYGGIRWGRENSRFRITRANKELIYRTTNPTLTFVFAPGIKLNKRQTLFINLGICRVLQANGGGGGSGSGQSYGKEYSYVYTDNLPPRSWDFRMGLKWQIKPKLEKKLVFELGLEPSLLKRKLDIVIKNQYSNIPDAVYDLSYEITLFYFGIQF